MNILIFAFLYFFATVLIIFSTSLLIDTFVLMSGWAPYLPSQKKQINKIIKYIKENYPKKDIKIAELGSGDGRIVVRLRKLGYEAIGFEFNPVLVIVSKVVALFKLRERKIFKLKNVFNADLSEYDVLIVYGITNFNKKLEPKIKKELKKGGAVISNTFEFKNLKLVDEFDKILVYTKN